MTKFYKWELLCEGVLLFWQSPTLGPPGFTLLEPFVNLRIRRCLKIRKIAQDMN